MNTLFTDEILSYDGPPSPSRYVIWISFDGFGEPSYGQPHAATTLPAASPGH